MHMENHLEYKGYHGSVEYDRTDNILHGKVRGIHSMVPYRGTSIDELKSDFAHSVDDYLGVCERYV